MTICDGCGRRCFIPIDPTIHFSATPSEDARRSLSVGEGWESLHSEGSNLSRFDFSSQNIQQIDFQSIAESLGQDVLELMRSMTSLNLSHNQNIQITENFTNLTGLKELILQNSILGMINMNNFLCDHEFVPFLHSLSYVDFSDNPVFFTRYTEFAIGLMKMFTCLEKLSLRNCGIDGEFFRRLINHNMQLKEIDLSNNCLTSIPWNWVKYATRGCFFDEEFQETLSPVKAYSLQEAHEEEKISVYARSSSSLSMCAGERTEVKHVEQVIIPTPVCYARSSEPESPIRDGISYILDLRNNPIDIEDLNHLEMECHRVIIDETSRMFCLSPGDVFLFVDLPKPSSSAIKV